MTIAKDSVVTKVVTAVVTFAAGVFMLGLTAAPAAAQSNAELEAQIQSLLETIASLQAQVDGDASSGYSSCPSDWLTDLGMGSQGQDVHDLQVFLNMDADTQVAASGPGSPGNETMYYGSLTAQAVSDFQVKYSADILAPLGLTSPTGYWGASSRETARELCADMGTDAGDDADDDSDSDSDSDDLEGGEASIEEFDVNSGDDSDVNEGETADVVEIEFEIEDGDARLSRLDLAASSTGNSTEDEPWDAFEEITLSIDGDEIASEDVSDEDDWLENDDEPYKYRFNNLDYVVREGEDVTIVVSVTAADHVDGAGSSASWDFYVAEDGLRAIDGEGINQYAPSSDSDKVNVDIDAEGSDDELEVNSSSDDPDASTLKVEDDKKKGWFDIFAFELSADDSDSDIEIDSIPVVITTGTADADDVVADLELVIDGETFDDFDWSNTSSTTMTATFDIDGDFTLEAGDEVDVFLGVEFKAVNGVNYNNGETISAKVEDGAIEGEGGDDVTSDGAATGETHTLLSEGIFAYDSSTETDTEGDDAGTTGVFTFSFTLEAFDDTFYLDTDGEGVTYTVNPQGGATSTYTSNTYAIQSDADETSGSFRIDEGSSEEFEFSVYLDPAGAGSYNVQLDSIDYGTSTSATSTGTYNFSPTSEYKTSNQYITNS